MSRPIFMENSETGLPFMRYRGKTFRMEGDKLIRILDPDTSAKIFMKSWEISEARARELAARVDEILP